MLPKSETNDSPTSLEESKSVQRNKPVTHLPLSSVLTGIL